MSEEIGPLSVHEIANERGDIHLRVEGTKAPTLTMVDGIEGDHEFVTEVTGGTVHCVIYADRRDAAEIAESWLLKELDGANWYALDRVGASAVEGRPFLYLSAVTRTGEGDARAWGSVQVAVGVVNFETFACVTERPGIRAAFLRIFEGAFQSLQTRDTEAPHDLTYQAVTILTSKGGTTAGFAEDFVALRTDGGATRQRRASRLTIVGERQLLATDDSRVERSIDDIVVLGHYQGRASDNLPYGLQMTLRSRGPSRYEVNGAVGDKPFEASFELETPMPELRAQVEELVRLSEGDAQPEVQYEEFDPTPDVRGPIGVRIVRRARDKEGATVALTVGSAEGTGRVNRVGQLVSTRFAQGGDELETRLVWATGTLEKNKPGARRHPPASTPMGVTE
ncbi:MAG: hypothetical protein WBG86_06105 [Polyangiales bacterium]